MDRVRTTFKKLKVSVDKVLTGFYYLRLLIDQRENKMAQSHKDRLTPHVGKIAGGWLFVLFLFSVGFPARALGQKEVLFVIDVQNEFAFDGGNLIGAGPEFYVNGGEDAGFQEGIILDVYRLKNIRDPFNGQEYEMRILVGQVKVIRVLPNMSVTRIHSLESKKTNPILDYETVMVGDLVLSRENPSIHPAHLSLPGRILFDFDSWKLKSTARHALSTVYDILEKSPDKKILIEGHTCDIGTNAYNRTLSLKRAQSAASFLMQAKGLSKERIQVMGFGEERPFASNDSDAERRKNRRVDFKFLPNETGNTKKS